MQAAVSGAPGCWCDERLLSRVRGPGDFYERPPAGAAKPPRKPLLLQTSRTTENCTNCASHCVDCGRCSLLGVLTVARFIRRSNYLD